MERIVPIGAFLTNGRNAAEIPTAQMVKLPASALLTNEGVLARDIESPDGSFIIPAGVDFAVFDTAREAIVRRIIASGISHVYIRPHLELSARDIEDVISRVYENSGKSMTVGRAIDMEKAAYVVKEVDTMFRKLETSDEVPRGIVSSLAYMGEDIAYDLMKDPSVAFSLAKVKDADEYTFVHSFNVSVLAGYLAARMRPDDKDFVGRVVLGGMLHDIGKTRTPKEILNKPGPLTAGEFEVLKRHPMEGVRIAISCGVTDDDILAMIGGHHEKWSGKGYPNKRAGENIPETARIAAVADVFDALTAKRVYKQPMSSRNAITLILKDAGTHFDAKIGRELLVGLGLYPPGSIVLLSDGRKGVVVSGGGRDLMRPVVMIHDDAAPPSALPEFIDLKKAGGLAIASFIGHGTKRDISLGGKRLKEVRRR